MSMSNENLLNESSKHTIYWYTPFTLIKFTEYAGYCLVTNKSKNTHISGIYLYAAKTRKRPANYYASY